MRPMRLRKREVTDADELRAIMEACQVVRLGVVDEEGVYIVPMNFGIDWALDGDGRPAPALWLHSAGEGRKADAFRACEADGAPVAIEMDIDDGTISGDYACSYSLAFRSIMGTGTVRAVTDAEEKVHGLTRLMEHAAPGAPITFSEQAVERTGVWCVDVISLTGKQRRPK